MKAKRIHVIVPTSLLVANLDADRGLFVCDRGADPLHSSSTCRMSGRVVFANASPLHHSLIHSPSDHKHHFATHPPSIISNMSEVRANHANRTHLISFWPGLLRFIALLVGSRPVISCSPGQLLTLSYNNSTSILVHNLQT